MTEKERLGEKCIKSEKVYDGSLLHVTRDTVKIPNGEEKCREVIGHLGAVCIVPFDNEGNIIVERQFRYPMNEVIYEIPAGKLDYPDEDRLDAAKRELREETGYTAENWVNLGEFYPAPAYSREVITLFMASGLTLGERELDDDENIDVIKMKTEDFVAMIDRGEIPDAKTQLGVLRAVYRRK